MANVGSPARGYYNDRTANAGAVKDLWVRFVGNGSSSPTVITNFGEIASITHTGTGAFTIQFTQSYYQLMGLTGSIAQTGGYSASGACYVNPVADTSEAANGTVKIQIVRADTGAAIDPASGDIVRICATVEVDSAFP